MTLFRAHYVVVETRYVSVLEVSHHSLHLLKSILERLKTNNINLQYWNYINCAERIRLSYMKYDSHESRSLRQFSVQNPNAVKIFRPRK